MSKDFTIAIILACLLANQVQSQDSQTPDTVTILSGKLTLTGLLWRPAGTGPFPTVIFCHGSYGGMDTIDKPAQQISLLGPVFVSHGFIYLGLFRRGVGLSEKQGINSTELMDIAYKERGQTGRNEMQIQQLLTDQLQDIFSGLTYLRGRKDVDTTRMAVVGHSFGGSLSLLVAMHEPGIKAAIVFAEAGYSWNLSPELRSVLIMTVKNIIVPVMIIHAQNDYSINPGYVLDSVMNKLNKPHTLIIYPKFGETVNDGHNLIFQGIAIWETDVFKFLNKGLRH